MKRSQEYCTQKYKYTEPKCKRQGRALKREGEGNAPSEAPPCVVCVHMWLTCGPLWSLCARLAVVVAPFGGTTSPQTPHLPSPLVHERPSDGMRWRSSPPPSPPPPGVTRRSPDENQAPTRPRSSRPRALARLKHLIRDGGHARERTPAGGAHVPGWPSLVCAARGAQAMACRDGEASCLEAVCHTQPRLRAAAYALPHISMPKMRRISLLRPSSPAALASASLSFSAC